jgi:hypothetical protein
MSIPGANFQSRISTLVGLPYYSISPSGIVTGAQTRDNGANFGPDDDNSSGINSAFNAIVASSDFQPNAYFLYLQQGVFSSNTQIQITPKNPVIIGTGPYGSEIDVVGISSLGPAWLQLGAAGVPGYRILGAGLYFGNFCMGYSNSATFTYGCQLGSPGVAGGDIASSAFLWENVRQSGTNTTFVGTTDNPNGINIPSYIMFDGIEDGCALHCESGAPGQTSYPSQSSPASISWIVNGGSAKIISGNYGPINIPSVHFSIKDAVFDPIIIGHISKGEIDIDGIGSNGVSNANQIYVQAGAGVQMITTKGIVWASSGSGYPYIGGPGAGNGVILTSITDKFTGVTNNTGLFGSSVTGYANFNGSWLFNDSVNATIANFLSTGSYIQGNIYEDLTGNWYNITPNSSTGGNKTIIATL